MNNRLYQYLIILMTISNASFVFANNDNVTNKKEGTAMPAAPSGPYRSQSIRDQGKQSNKQLNVSQGIQQPKQSLPATKLAQRPPQHQMRPPVAPPAWVNKAPPQRMMVPNWNQNVPPQAQWAQRAPVAPPAWVNKTPPQHMLQPNWNQNIPLQPQWSQRPPQHQMHPPVAPPAWANKAPPQRMMAPNWNQNIPPQPQWVPPEIPDWVKNPPHAPKPPKWVTSPPAPPAWVKNIPQQRMQPPQVPEWVKNPPYGPKPPEWVINPPQYPVYRGQN